MLKIPPPEVIDHAPVVAPPPTVAPESVIADGVGDWQTVKVPPVFTVGAALIIMVLVALITEQAVDAFVVSVNVTVPLKLAAGV